MNSLFSIDHSSDSRSTAAAVIFVVFFLPTIAAASDPPAEADDPTLDRVDAIPPSDSPHLRPPEYLQELELITPYSGPAGPRTGDPTATVTHDLASSTTSVVPTANAADSELAPEASATAGFSGSAPPVDSASDVVPRSVIGTDDRSRVFATGSFPWRTVVRLAVQWSDGSGGLCSGAIISPYHVLTAGHCVFDFGDTDDWADSIQVFPGLDDDQMPYNFAWATRYHSYTGWTESGDSEHDWAVIALDRRVGDSTGWMGRLTAGSGHSVYTGTLNVAGYPGTPNGNATCPTWGNCQYWDSDSGEDADDFNHWYWMDTSGGMSGGPVWRFISDTDERHIVSTHTCGTGGCGVGNSGGANHGTRLNQDKYDRIPTWIDDDSDIAPTDRADLIDDGEAFSGFTPTHVRGGQSFQSWSDVRNIGTASSGGFYVSYFASTNDFISTSDYLIGHDFTGSVSSFNKTDSSLALAFPESIPDGSYYVGWIVDRFDSVTEFDEDNNKAFVSDQMLEVCQRADRPSLLSPGDGDITSDHTPFFDWTAVGDADDYRIQIDDDPSFGSPNRDVSTSSSSYTPSFELSGGIYYWRVRSDKDCGTDGLWTSSRSIVIDDVIFSDKFEG